MARYDMGSEMAGVGVGSMGNQDCFERWVEGAVVVGLSGKDWVGLQA